VSITSALVLFAVIWFMVFFVVLPLRLVTQGEDGNIVPGTHASAPSNPHLGRKVRLTTIWAVGLWILIGGTILSGVITVRDIDVMNRMGPAPTTGD
jgi:predicted secreted protein